MEFTGDTESHDYESCRQGGVTVPADLCRVAGFEPGADLVAEVQGAPRRFGVWGNRRPPHSS
jgi:hypothetical protein